MNSIFDTVCIGGIPLTGFYKKLVVVVQSTFALITILSLLTVWQTPNFDFLAGWAGALGLALVLLFCFILFRPSIRFKVQSLNFSKKSILFSLFLLLIYQILCYSQLTIQSNWDPGVLIQNAEHATSLAYFSWNYNNTFLLLIEQFLYKALVATGLFSNILKALFLCNALALDTALFGIYLVGRTLKDSNFGTLLFLVSCLYWGISPWILEFYSDTLGLFAVVYLLWFIVKIQQATTTKMQIVWLLSYVVWSLASYLLKPTTFIVSIALTLITLSQQLHPKPNRSKTAHFLLYFVGALSLFGLGNHFYTTQVYQHLTFSVAGESKHLNPELRTPPDHFIAMGLTGIGGFNNQDTNETHQVPTYARRKAMNQKKIKQRLQHFGFLGYLKFLSVKFNNNVANGNFTWDGDSSFLHQNIGYPIHWLSKVSAAFNFPDGHYRKPMRVLNQVSWILLLFFSGLSILVPRSKTNFLLYLCQLTIVGLQIYLLIFEGGTSRYLFMWLPCFILTAVYGFEETSQRISNWHSQSKKLQFSGYISKV